MSEHTPENDVRSRFLGSDHRFPVFLTCPICFALVDLEHLEAHDAWHFPPEVTP